MVKSVISVILAAGSLAPLVLAAPSKLLKARAVQDAYTFYQGQATQFPAMSSWFSSVDDMFNANAGLMSISCSQFGVANNSPSELSALNSAIKQVSASTGVDARFILAVVIQESKGCVRAPTTNYGVRNPGLMQDHNGSGTCNEDGVQNPCPSSQILQMIRDGTAGTSSGDGLQQLLAQATGSGDAKYYQAARMYNSGSIAASGNLNDGIATKCYVNDVANRLTGWVSAGSSCDNGQYVPGSGSSSSSSQLIGAGSASSATSKPSSYPSASSAKGSVPSSSVKVSVPSSSAKGSVSSSSSKGSAPSSVGSSRTSGSASSATSAVVQQNKVVTATNLAPGTTTKCAQYYRVVAGDYCNLIVQRFGTTFTQFRQLNSKIDNNCSNLFLGYDYCVKPSS